MKYLHDEFGNCVRMYSFLHGREYTLADWHLWLSTQPNTIATYAGYQWNQNEVCTNPKIAENVTIGKTNLKIKVAQFGNGCFVTGFDYSYGDGGVCLPTSPNCKEDISRTEIDAVTRILRIMLDASDMRLVALAKKALCKYESRELQLSLF